jgi:hypothetical protein
MDPIVLLNGRYLQHVDHVLLPEVHNGLSLFYGLNFDQIIPTLAALNRKNRNRLSNQNSRFFGIGLSQIPLSVFPFVPPSRCFRSDFYVFNLFYHHTSTLPPSSSLAPCFIFSYSVRSFCCPSPFLSRHQSVSICVSFLLCRSSSER